MKKDFWIVNKVNKDTAEVFLYDYIGFTDGSTSNFVQELTTLDKTYQNIDLRINSNGGSVFDGIAIVGAMKRCKATITAYVDGVAASMAAVIFLHAPNRHMNKYARLMTHQVQGGCWGSAEELRNAADLCEGLENDLADIISKATGLSVENTKKKYITNTDRWLTAAAAEKEGLIHGVFDGEEVEVPKNMGADDLFNLYKGVLNAKIDNHEEVIYLL